MVGKGEIFGDDSFRQTYVPTLYEVAEFRASRRVCQDRKCKREINSKVTLHSAMRFSVVTHCFNLSNLQMFL